MHFQINKFTIQLFIKYVIFICENKNRSKYNLKQNKVFNGEFRIK